MCFDGKLGLLLIGILRSMMLFGRTNLWRIKELIFHDPAFPVTLAGVLTLLFHWHRTNHVLLGSIDIAPILTSHAVIFQELAVENKLLILVVGLYNSTVLISMIKFFVCRRVIKILLCLNNLDSILLILR